MKKNTTKKTLVTALACMVIAMTPFNAFADTGVTTARIFGSDRVGTAVAIADAGWTTVNTVILAPMADANLVDALAAAPLAGKNTPILLTENNTLTDATKAELVKLGTTQVYVVGAISQTVVDQVNAMTGVTVTVLKGADRTDTATAIASKLTAPAGSFVVGYGALADALSVASYAAANNYAILVANPDGTLPASETAYKGANTYIIGGPTLVADIAGATRLFGADRFATNQIVLNQLTYQYNNVYVANGTDAHLVDSLVASPLAAKSGAPIVLTDTEGDGAGAANSVSAKLIANAVVTALGGSAIVSDANVAQFSTGVTSVSTTVAVTGLTLNQPTLALMTGGANGTLAATVAPSNATNQVVTWATSNAAVATVVNGVVTPVGAGTATITATTQDGAMIATCAVTVSTGTIPVTGLTLDQPTLALTTGQANGTLVATVAPSNATNQVVNWTTSNAAVATVVNGVVTPVGAGTATVTATTQDGGMAATSVVTVSAGTITYGGHSSRIIAVTGLTLDQPTLALTTGAANGTLVATIAPTNATNQVVTWTTSDATVATVVNGVVTPIGAGTATITATTQDGDMVANSIVTVSAARTTDIITGTTYTANNGSLVTINLTSPVNYVGATQFQVYVNGEEVSSLAPLNTATTVSPAQASGSVVQVEFLDAAGMQVGTTQNVTLQSGDPNVAVTGITVAGAASVTTVANGATLQMSDTVLPTNATSPAVTWSVSPGTGTATISSTGLLTGTGIGTVTVTATDPASGVTGTAVINVIAATTAWATAPTYAGFGQITGKVDPAVVKSITAVDTATGAVALVAPVINADGTFTIDVTGHQITTVTVNALDASNNVLLTQAVIVGL